ncbi:MAG: M56 family metallopeptidase, partial [Planctomycetota bacterium]
MITFLNTAGEHWYTWQIAMLWQTAALIAIIWGIDLLIRRWAHPQVRYALWMLVLVKLLIPPTWTSPASITSHIPGLAHRAATVMERANVSEHHTEIPATMMERAVNVPPASSRQVN